MSLSSYIETDNKDLFDEKVKKPIKEVAEELFERANGDEQLQVDYLDKLIKMIYSEQNLIRKNTAIAEVSKIFKVKKSELEKLVKQFKDVGTELKEDGFLPKHKDVDAEKAYAMGWYEYIGKGKQAYDTGYWFRQNSAWVHTTNFVVKPLYHIYSDVTEENRRMLLVTNGIDSRVVELQSKQMMSIDGFCGTLYGQGHFIPIENFGKPQLLKVINGIGDNFPMIYEMKKLGWQSEGVFAFFNRTFIPPKKETERGKLSGYDEYGVTKEKFGDKHLFSPAIGKGQELTRTGDDIYENDRYLEWKQSPIDFTDWCELFVKVYGTKAYYGISFIAATLMRDIITQHNKVPLLYFYGPTGSGKSEICESILNFFYSGKDEKGDLYKPFNLNQGTEFAFFNALETNSNTPFVGNEFDENTLSDERFMAMKAGYDGEGRLKGSGQKGRSKEQKIVRTIILAGQFLGTKDDNSVINRSIPESVLRVDNRAEEQVIAHGKLKSLEKEGLSSLVCDVLELRPSFKNKYGERFFVNQKRFQEKATASGLSVQSRILRNVACLYTCMELMVERFSIGCTLEEYFEQCFAKMKELTMLVVRTSKVSEFWRMVEYLLDRELIFDKVHFKVQEVTELRARRGDDNNEEKFDFAVPRKILFLRLGTVYTTVEKEISAQNRNKLMNQESFLLYAKDQPWFYGFIQGKKFNSKPTTGNALNSNTFTTSCYAFDYEALKISLIRDENAQYNEPPELPVTGGEKDVEDVF